MQDKEHLEEIAAFQMELNQMFADTNKSPLTEKDREEFKGLEFFQADNKYRVEASFSVSPDSEPFQMPTTTSRLVWYKKYGEANFNLGGRDLKLAVYQNQELANREGYEDFLFLPYKDWTNGIETYGGGRYIDLKIPENNSIIIDFNKSYNPYCAYNHKYSCPIPPDENHLEVEIRAGVLAWKH